MINYRQYTYPHRVCKDTTLTERDTSLYLIQITIFMSDSITRLKRVHGQIQGIINMLENGEDCEKIIIQFQAAKEALNSAFTQHLSQNIEQCLLEKDSQKIEKLLKLVVKQ